MVYAPTLKLLAIYSVAGDLWERKLSRIGGEQEIREENFVDCLVPPITCGYGSQFSQRKLDTKPRNSQKFSPSKNSRYTV